MSTVHPKILGLSAFFHDSSAALVVDGELVAAAAEERFSLHKHDANFPHRAVRFCLEQGLLEPEELDEVVFYEDPALKFTRVLASTLADFPSSLRAFVSGMQDWLGNKLWLQYHISRYVGVDPRRVRFASHHESHAAQAFLMSPFSESAILVVDAVGEWDCTTVGKGRYGSAEPIQILEKIPYPHSLGLAYAAFTGFLGFRPNEGEASTMALAAFGKPTFATDVRRIICPQSDGTYRLSQGYFDFLSSGTGLFTRKLTNDFGAPRDHRTAIPFDALGNHFASGHVTEDDQRWADIAASVQLVLEETLLSLGRRALAKAESKNLCLAGGVALNAVANSKVLEHSGAQEMFVPPDPGDGGAAIGSALLSSYRATGRRRPATSVYTGKAFDEREAGDVVRNADPKDWSAHLLEGCNGASEELSVDELNGDRLTSSVVEELLEGRIVGWVQGRFELGPRALGNRSILVDPANLAAVRRLSEQAKKRASFRPYALSVREEDASLVFDFAGGVPLCARWMLTVNRVRVEAVPLVRGAMHIDGTTRVQVCAHSDNPRFHELLSAFAMRRGLGALLNTSFNERGYPMVASPVGALLMFARTDMDVLVIENLVIKKSMAGKRNVAIRSDQVVAVGAASSSGNV